MPIHVDITTPEKFSLSDDVDFLSAPAFDGEIGILPHHAPLLTRLGIGELKLKKGSEITYFAVTGGFLEVQYGSRVSVFAETAELAEEIDVERAKQAVERAKARLASPDLTGMELAAVEASLSRAILRMKVGDIRGRRQSRRPEDSRL